MSLKEDLDALDPAEEVQKAFDESAATKWTIARHSAAMSMGVEILTGVFGPDMDRLKSKGAYPNVLRDVVIALWLCDLSPEDVIRINARLNIDQAIASAYAWAETKGIRYGTPKYLDGVQALTQICAGVYASFYAVEGNGSKPELAIKKNTRRRGKSTSRTTRSRPAENPVTTS